MLRPFELHRPATVMEAASLLAARPDAALYAGGTELLLLMKAGLVRPADVIDLKRIADLGGIEDGHDSLTIGATVTHRALERTAVVVGNLTTPGIVIEEGAKLKGRIVIGSDAEIAVETENRKVQALKKPAAAAKPAEAVAASQVVATSA